jgi:hypothetical protein
MPTVSGRSQSFFASLALFLRSNSELGASAPAHAIPVSLSSTDVVLAGKKLCITMVNQGVCSLSQFLKL